MAKNIIRSLLKSTGYLVVSKWLIKEIGFNPAILLSDLLSKEEYFEKRNRLEDGFFYNSQKNIEKDTGLSPYQQRNALNRLKKKDLVKVKKEGMPAKYYYKINYQSLKNLITSPQETKAQVIKKLNINNNKNKNNNKLPSLRSGISPLPLKELAKLSGFQQRTPVQQVISYWIKIIKENFGTEPYINWGKDGKLVKDAIKGIGIEKTKKVLDWYIESKRFGEHGPNISAALSSYNINLWKGDNEIYV